MHHMPLPDGYRWTGRTLHEMVLIDPLTCPAGHPVTLVRRAHELCDDWSHGIHKTWQCSCGQTIYREGGAFVGEVACLHSARRSDG